MVNTMALKCRMVDYDITISEIADICDISVSKMRFILNNDYPMTLDIAEIMQKILDIEDEDFGYYFLGGSCIS